MARSRSGWLGLVLAAGVVLANGAASGRPAGPQRAPSLGPPPVKIDVQSCPGLGMANCVDDVWGGNFEFRISPHVIRVGETLTATVTDGTDAYGHSWTWGAPTPLYGASPGGATLVSCSPPMAKWTRGPSSGHCAWKMNEPVEHWTAFGATVNPLGQAYTDQDYYAVLADKYLLHGYVRDTENKGIRGARVDFTGPSGDLYATTNRAGYYDAILKQGIYSVGVSADQKLCAAERTECENPTKVNLVTDKELDFGPPGGVVVTGRVLEHRKLIDEGKTAFEYDYPLPSATVTAAAIKGGRHYTAVTDAAGEYRLELPAGAYNIRVAPSGRTDREKYLPDVAYVERASGTVTRDFQLVPADRIDLRSDTKLLVDGKPGFMPAASGADRARIEITLENARGDPKPWRLSVRSVADTASTVAHPAVFFCIPGGGATGSSGGQGLHGDGTFDTQTGMAELYAFFGNDIGTATIHVEALKEPGASDDEVVRTAGSTVQPDSGLIQDLFEQLAAQELSENPSTAVLEETVVEWLLTGVHQGRQLPYGDFVPIYSDRASLVPFHRPAGIVFYPSGSGSQLLEHLVPGSHPPLPAGYKTVVVPIVWDLVEGVAKVRADEPMTLTEWEQRYGVADWGTLESPTLANFAFLGGPYPPAYDDPLRPVFARCAPSAVPKTTTIEVHSPLRVLVQDAAGHRFGYDEQGRLVNQLAGFIEHEKGGVTSYVIPRGSYDVSLTGTGPGAATLVVSTPGARGEQVSVFSLSSRKGATGTLRLTAAGAAATVRFDGHAVRASSGVGLRVSGLPRTLKRGAAARLVLRVTDQFGKPVGTAFVAVTAKGVKLTQPSGPAGKASVAFTAPQKGKVTVTVTAVGYATATAHIAVRA